MPGLNVVRNKKNGYALYVYVSLCVCVFVPVHTLAVLRVTVTDVLTCIYLYVSVRLSVCLDSTRTSVCVSGQHPNVC